MLPCH